MVATLAAHGLVLSRQVHCAWWPPQAQAALAEALAATSVAERPTAVVAMNDRIAMGVYQAAADLRMRVPRDLSVVSFDNSELSWWLSPGLTSIGLPYYELGRRSVEVLLGVAASDTVERIHTPLHQRSRSPAAPRPALGASSRHRPTSAVIPMTTVASAGPDHEEDAETRQGSDDRQGDPESSSTPGIRMARSTRTPAEGVPS